MAAMTLAFLSTASAVETGFLDRSIVFKGVTYKYQVFVPNDWTAAKRWPVILFLHGIGESGEDGLVQTEVGIGTAIRRDRARFPAIVVMPQTRKGVRWAQAPMGDVVIAALNMASKEFHGNARRTYLTGLSMGGFGTWSIAAANPGRFAALVPVCGGVTTPGRDNAVEGAEQYLAIARRIGAATPVWIFHGDADPIVPASESRRMNEAMKTLGGEVRYTEYPGVGHDSWINAYAEPELIPWLLSKSLAARR